MSKVMRQKPAQAGPVAVVRGEAAHAPTGDETCDPRHATLDIGSATPGSLLRAALTRENMQQALKRVKANKGAAGVDGLDIAQTIEHLRTHWSQIRQQLLQGNYRPSPVRRVAIPKPDGGQRELGIPTVTDRLIQQALLQVLQPLIDPTFSEHSYGFRPGRRAHDAVKAAQSYVQSGRRVVVGPMGWTLPPLAASNCAKVEMRFHPLQPTGASEMKITTVGVGARSDFPSLTE
jgi:hypothetical protein